ncbi:Hypothetical predicted protein [Cloeon dipterum]|uniref:Uncharacterized protein n=1 Tax=Cloeon dipterum TaxID=197152 RepID=A0A8S1DQF1_9INSE|nr:Hypothetical predicted protein [Cloeon dipterum]
MKSAVVLILVLGLAQCWALKLDMSLALWRGGLAGTDAANNAPDTVKPCVNVDDLTTDPDEFLLKVLKYWSEQIWDAGLVIEKQLLGTGETTIKPGRFFYGDYILMFMRLEQLRWHLKEMIQKEKA